MGRSRTLAVAVVAVAVLAAAARVAAQARPPRCAPSSPPAPVHCTTINQHNNNLYEFTVEGNYFGMEYVDGKYLSLRCGARGPSLESDALPRFESELRVERVAVEGCAGAPYAAVLRALNVTARRAALDLAVRNARALAPAHLAGLGGVVRALELRRAGAPAGPLLAQLPRLAALTVVSTRLPRGELDAPPRALEHVHLADAGVTRLPAAVLALPALRWLTVIGSETVQVERAPASPLVYLHVAAAEAALLAEWAPPALEVAYLSRWGAAAPPALAACARLATLTLVSPALRALPPAWLARCPRLATLEVKYAARLRALPPRLLANASSLTRLAFRSGALEALPSDLFEDTPRLTHLDLSGNRLKELPSGVLGAPARALLALDLSGNALSARVGAALAALASLRNLSLANNPLADLCKPDDTAYLTVIKNKSPLASLSKLENLNLKNTNVSVICSDWRTDLRHLVELDLRETKVASLTYEDMKYTREARGGVVLLTGAPLRHLHVYAEDYEAARGAARGAGVTVTVGGAGTNLTCDCWLYWAARALEEGVLPVRVEGGLRCAGGGDLRDARPDDLACPAPRGACPARLPPACSCAAAAGGAVLRVRCEGAALARVPRARNLTALAALDLLLANNSIAALAPDDIPPTFRILDLRNNSIERLEEATALALVGRREGEGEGERRVLLAGNPLDCSCRTARARRVLRALPGHGALRCRDGAPLAAAPEAECPATGALAALAGAAVVAVALGAAVAGAGRARLALRRRLKALLGRAGAHADRPRPYDAFVTFGRGDEAAALEVASRLEGEGGRRRVLLQERDWLPPAWVPRCLEASVAAARRTVALVSPAWERALESGEVRAAFEPAWRGALVLVLPPAGGDVRDAALRRYAREYPHLVVRRGCWRGLERALPPPAAPPPA